MAPLLGSDLFNYCKLPPWPLLNNRFFVLKNFLVDQKKKNNRKIDSNRKSIGIQLEKAALIQVNNFSFAHAIHLEMINQKITGAVGRQYRAASTAFLALPEWGILALYPYENKV